MAYRSSKMPLVMRAVKPDLVDYSWLVSGLCDCLLKIDQRVRQPVKSDVVTKEITAILGSMAGALQLIGECALQTIIRKWIAVLSGKPVHNPGMSPASSMAMRRFVYAVMAYLEEIRHGVIPSVLYLYPYYYGMMYSLGEKNTHPADLYYAQFTQKIQLVEQDFLKEIRPYQPTDTGLLKSDFEKEFRLYMQNFGGGSKERVHILAMHRILGALVEQQETLERRAFWSVVLGFSEVVAMRQIDSDVYVQQLYQCIANHLRRVTTDTPLLEEMILTHALFYIAHVPGEEESVAIHIKAHYLMPAVGASDYKQLRYMTIDPVVLARLKDRINLLQSLWSDVAEGVSHAEIAFVKAVEGLKGQGELLGSPDITELFSVLRRSAGAIVRNRSAYSVKLEVTRNLLFVESVLDSIYRLPSQLSHMVRDASFRLASSLSKHYPGEQLQSLKTMIADEHYIKISIVVADEILSHLQQLEMLLQQLLFAPGDRMHLRKANALFDSLDSIFVMLNYQAPHQATSYAKSMILKMCDDVFDRKKLWCMMNNLGVLSFFARDIRNMTYMENTQLHFDEATGMLMARAENHHATPSALVWQPHPDNFALHCAARLQHSQIAEQILLEDEIKDAYTPLMASDTLINSFLSELEELVEDVSSILPLSRLSPADMGHIESLHDVFYALESKSRMAGVSTMSDAAMKIAHTLNGWIADNRSGSEELYLLLEQAHALIVQWLSEMRLQGQSGRMFTMLAVAATRLAHGHGTLQNKSC